MKKYAETHWTIEDVKGAAESYHDVTISDEVAEGLLQSIQSTILDAMIIAGNDIIQDAVTDYLEA